jgi:hypothetical protein
MLSLKIINRILENQLVTTSYFEFSFEETVSCATFINAGTYEIITSNS